MKKYIMFNGDIMKTDLRIIKTKNNLHDALISLLKEKTFENIKVSDICEKALINRSTFYSHYNDKYELLLDSINTIKSNLLHDLEENEHNIDTREYYIELIKLLLNHIEEMREIYKPILLNNRNSIIMDIILDVAKKDIEKRLENGNFKSKVPIDILTTFYLGAIIGIGIDTLENNKYEKQELIDYIDILLPKNI